MNLVPSVRPGLFILVITAIAFALYMRWEARR